MSSSVLALLVAVISVAALSLPVAKEAMAPRNSRVRVALQGIVQNKAYVMVSNLGDRPGSINSVSVSGPTFVEGSTVMTALPLEPTIIPPGGAKQLVFDLTGFPQQVLDEGAVEALRRPDHRFGLLAEVRDFNDFANGSRQLLSVDPDDAFAIGATTWHACPSIAALSAEEGGIELGGLKLAISREEAVAKLFPGCGTVPDHLREVQQEWLVTRRHNPSAKAAPAD